MRERNGGLRMWRRKALLAFGPWVRADRKNEATRRRTPTGQSRFGVVIGEEMRCDRSAVLAAMIRTLRTGGTLT
ncbi:hypothetical protein CIC12_00790 [Burkholderia sp. SG-MS1]|nr:hypothetical protein [Paraburkholderia sp. SG-MS1]